MSKKPVVTVMIMAGAVAEVEIDGGPVRLNVRDYDVTQSDHDKGIVHIDEDGQSYALETWEA